VTNQSQQLFCEFFPNPFLVPAVSEPESGGAFEVRNGTLGSKSKSKGVPFPSQSSQTEALARRIKLEILNRCIILKSQMLYKGHQIPHQPRRTH